MTLELSEHEIKILKIWSDNVIHSGHYGDGDITLPDEHIILQKINQTIPDSNVIFTEQDIRIILIWSDTNYRTPEEIILINKLKSLLPNPVINDFEYYENPFHIFKVIINKISTLFIKPGNITNKTNRNKKK